MANDSATVTCEPGCACGDATLCGQRDAYVYAWGNNERRAELKGRPCVVLASGRMSTVLIEMLDTGERVTTSRRAIRRRAAPTREEAVSQQFAAEYGDERGRLLFEQYLRAGCPKDFKVRGGPTETGTPR